MAVPAGVHRPRQPRQVQRALATEKGARRLQKCVVVDSFGKRTHHARLITTPQEFERKKRLKEKKRMRRDGSVLQWHALAWFYQPR